MDDVTILPGDALAMLRGLPDASVHCICTSPPYYGLRRYIDDAAPEKIHEIGLEPTVGAYVARLVAVFAECWRVLRDDGTLWLNLGDSYNGSGGAGGDYGKGGIREGQPKYPGRRESNLKPKDLIGVPWRVAFALQDAGWWLRSDIIWAKTAPMPESVTDRPTRSHEYIFLLTKRARYYYDNLAVAEPSEYGELRATFRGGGTYTNNNSFENGTKIKGDGEVRRRPETSTRNQRDVWTLGPESFSGAHFAVFPTEIPRRAILAGTSERGCCPACGSPWARVVEREPDNSGYTNGPGGKKARDVRGNGASENSTLSTVARYASTTTGWRPTCACDAGEPQPCTVLDPFGGSGTTAAVAVGLGRHAIICELNADYIELARDRIAAVQRPLTLNL